MIRILTDSAADLTPADADRPYVYIAPLTVTFADGTNQLDGIDISGDAYYERLKGEKQLPRTSQPSPEAFLKVFEAAKEAGDQVIAILISSTLSGTYQCARMAAQSCDFEDVFFVDSRTGSQGEAILVREALRLRDEERLPAHAIVAELEQLKSRIRIVAVVDSLKHLHKGGRLPAAVALVGGALGVKPVLSVVDGEIRLADTARGRPGAYVALFKQIDKMGGIDPRYGYVLLYSDEKGVLAPIHHYLHENLRMTGGRIARLGAVIGTHVGPGCAALVFVARED
ncbi:MAG: DegV family protein [Gemmiger sp.]|uniref:DegV family protein n=1 Tax=Gemmiger sp. TaxID=2049027 RepID=UPI002E75DC3B|nr:DegV family protein [Gemmiger sp.]MEE0802029.1 DegV family protein [Gemmiger sp.]